MKETTEAVVIGGGPAGLTAAIALASAGVETAVVGMPPAAADNRTTALLASSVTALDVLGVWERCAGQSAPLRRMRHSPVCTARRTSRGRCHCGFTPESLMIWAYLSLSARMKAAN